MKTNCIVEPKPSTRIAELRDLLGHDVLLLPCIGKLPRGKWGKHTIKDMSDPAYLTKLTTGNIGVVLGKKSNGLCAIDIDDDLFVEPFLKTNPQLAKTLRTRGARGNVFWLRMIGDYPATFDLKTRCGDHAGEWRGNNAQSIIAGRHPDTRRLYSFVNKKPPLKLAYSQIDFSCFGEQKKEGPICQNRVTTSPTSSTPSLCHSVTPSLCKVEDAVKMALPKTAGANHQALFLLARAVKTLEAKGVIAGQQGRIKVFNAWYRQAAARGILRAKQSRDEYLLEYLNAYRTSKYSIGESAADLAWAAALREPFPPEADYFETKTAKRFVNLCFQMHQLANGNEWFLPTRKAGQLFGVSHTQAATWLGGLVALGVLTISTEHTTVKATRYKYQSGESSDGRTKATSNEMIL